MKNSFLVIGAVLLFASVAAASDVPTAETVLGYNLVRFNPNSGLIPTPRSTTPPIHLLDRGWRGNP
jgi:hypothetical protein